MARIIHRGDIWVVNLEPSFGKEIHKKRPALIISDIPLLTHTGHVIIIPTSSLVPKKLGIEMISVGKDEGVHKASVLLPVFIRSIDEERLIEKIGSVNKTTLEKVEQAIRLILFNE